MEYAIDYLPLDIIRIIHSHLDFPSQLNVIYVSTLFNKLSITNLLDNVHNEHNLTNDILKLYPHITKIFLSYFLNDISNIINLQVLCIEHTTIDNSQINLLTNLTSLSIMFGNKITNIKSLTNLTELYISTNDKITDINHLKNLHTLGMGNYLSAPCYCAPMCGITNNGLSSLTNLTHLDIYNNSRITDINCLTNLRILNATGDCGVEDNGIKKLTNLVVLHADSNEKITNVNHLINLKILHAEHTCGISNDGISSLTNLTELYYRYNNKITKKIE
jgi:hypothetical protein